MSSATFIPSKSLWTQDDFEQMCWHDNRLHGIDFVDDFEPHEHEIRFDIDYLFKWVGHGGEEGPSGFWIAPSTLVFPGSSINLSIDGNLFGTWIMGIERYPCTEQRYGAVKWTWEMSLNTGGTIIVRSDTYTQYTRQYPRFLPTPRQCLETGERGGISFDKLLYDA
jgi:hypothetical protein